MRNNMRNNMRNDKKLNIAIIGVRGNIGREIFKSLEDSEIEVSKLFLLSANSKARVTEINKKISELSFREKSVKIESIDDFDFLSNKIDVSFFCTSDEVSSKYVKKALEAKSIVIDKSSFFRMNKDVPLVVSEINMHLLNNKDLSKGYLITNPNCCALPISIVLNTLNNIYKIKRVVISTYQSVSGAGREAMNELHDQVKEKFMGNNLKPKIFEKEIAFNLIPKIGNFDENGNSGEEVKIMQEIKKILDCDIDVSVTCVRVPVFVSHSFSINIEFENDISDINEINNLLEEDDSIILHKINDDSQPEYATPIEASFGPYVFVSRVRKDPSKNNAINLFVVCDNLRKGAALNSIDILKYILTL